MKILEPGESTGGVYPMPELPWLERVIISALLDDDRIYGEHVCNWIIGEPSPGPAECVDHCNCGAVVRFARKVAGEIVTEVLEASELA